MKGIRNQRGFTLIELLVVIAILGVIAAVIGLNISNFFKPATITAANIERHQVQTAIIAYQADDGDITFNATIGPESNYPVNAPATEGVHKYVISPGMLQADYTVVDGVITDAVAINGSKWRDLYFCNGAWQIEECPE